jgi:hypothetical protein
MKKVLILGLSGLMGFSLSATAQVNAVGIGSLASQFAMQAGTIAGIVQSCGQSVVEYNSRVLSALNTLAKTPQEQLQAMAVYQKSLSDAQQAQERTHSVNCGEAMQSFNSLPLMQPDYKKTVLPQLAKMANPQTFGARAAEGQTITTTAKPPATTAVTTPTPGSQ